MFELIESCPERREGMGWTGRIVSALIHMFLISAAIAATRGVLDAVEDDGPHDFDVTWPQPPHLAGEPGHWGVAPVTPVATLVISSSIPDPGNIMPDIPGGEPAPWTPGGDPGPALPPGTITGTGGSLPLLDARQVDEQPELLSHPTLRYPDVLRRAGIEGRVMVEVVLDSLGRAEPGSARVATSSHQLFDPEALAVVSGSVYRPARVSGRAVRVRVRVPVSFTLRT